MEKKLPPSYMNLGYDEEGVAGPSAPIPDEATGSQVVSAEPQPGPSIPPPKYEEVPDPIVLLAAPTAPPTEVNVDPNALKYISPYLVFEDIYETLVKYANNHCCYSSRFARQMKLTEIKNDCAFHYVLETFAEKRETATREVPYRGGSIDGPSNGHPPKPWDMDIPLPTLFKDSKTYKSIPHTESVQTCWKCSGSGKVTCGNCNGRGKTSCWKCSGSGRNSEDERCSSCGGDGDERCSRCNGSGDVTCPECSGYGELKSYEELIVTWKNHVSQFVSDIKKLPTKKFIKGEGDTLFTQERLKLSPITNAPNSSVNTASFLLLERYNSIRSEEIRRQRHRLRAIPFTIVRYKWKEEEGEFYIYGKEREVYFETYPTSCCCCICC